MYSGGRGDRGLRGETFWETAMSINHRSRRGIRRTLLTPDFQRQSPDHMGGTEQRSHSHKGVCSIRGYCSEYWGLWQHCPVYRKI